MKNKIIRSTIIVIVTIAIGILFVYAIHSRYSDDDGQPVLTETELLKKYKISRRTYTVTDSATHGVEYFDANGRLIKSVTYNDAAEKSVNTTTNSYDGTGKLIVCRRYDSKKVLSHVVYLYKNDLLMREKDNITGKETTYRYDENKKLVKKIEPTTITEYFYDDETSQLTKETSYERGPDGPGGEPQSTDSETTTYYTYDDDGRKEKVSSTDTFIGRCSSEWKYDKKGRVTRVINTIGPITREINSTYNDKGLLEKVAYEGLSIQTYTYYTDLKPTTSGEK